MNKILFGLLGAGGSGREVMPYARESIAKMLKVLPCEVDAYFVETWEPKTSMVNSFPLISLDAFLSLPGQKYFNVAVGDGRMREAMVQKVAKRAESIAIHAPQVIFFDNNLVGEGAVFCPNTMVTSNVKIGCFFHANSYSSVAHDCVIGNFVTLAPGARCNGRVHIGDYAYIGSNAVIREGTADKPLRIGAGAIVGMGAVVTKDVPDGITVIGNPARPMVKNG
jgi:sugar O-acyltransferase (sialic acid O-acetyltransferase NeuD family)